MGDQALDDPGPAPSGLSVSAGCAPRSPPDGPAPRAGRSGRTRAGSGCPGARTASRAASSTPSASTSPAAQSSIRTPGTVSRGNPIEPARGRTHVNRSAQSSKNPSRRSRFAATIPRDRARTTIAGTQRDERQDLRRRRRADRRVVLERPRSGRAGRGRGVASQPIRRPASANDLDMTPSETPALEGVGAGWQPIRLVELEEAVDLVGEEVDAARGQLAGQRRPLRGRRAASRSGCAGR